MAYTNSRLLKDKSIKGIRIVLGEKWTGKDFRFFGENSPKTEKKNIRYFVEVMSSGTKEHNFKTRSEAEKFFELKLNLIRKLTS